MQRPCPVHVNVSSESCTLSESEHEFNGRDIKTKQMGKKQKLLTPRKTRRCIRTKSLEPMCWTFYQHGKCLMETGSAECVFTEHLALPTGGRRSYLLSVKYQSEGTLSLPLFPHLVESLPTLSGFPGSEKSLVEELVTQRYIQQLHKQREARLGGREAPPAQTSPLSPFSAM